ncbi:hypothetical protein Trihar35433_5191 [Trichoderma harzianum]|nr:hypothetical protein Trihar35433_5191 [Trichoderma harzianum]
MKVKNKLRTVSAETINWFKDNDVTWLYGPLQSGTKPIHNTRAEQSNISLSKTDSRVNPNKKQILKKRKQAAATIQAQETRSILRPSNNRRGIVDVFAYPFSSRRTRVDSSGLASPTESYGITSTSAKRREIRFNEQVEQCIAININGDDKDEMKGYPDCYGDNSDSDDGVMLKQLRTKKQTAKAKWTEDKTIAKLSSTTLKGHKDTRCPRSPPLSPSSWQETMLPSKPSRGFFFGEHDNEEALLRPGWLSLPADSKGDPTPMKAFMVEFLTRSTPRIAFPASTGRKREILGAFVNSNEESPIATGFGLKKITALEYEGCKSLLYTKATLEATVNERKLGGRFEVKFKALKMCSEF